MQWLPELLEQRQWDCPEAIELNKWTHVVVKRLSKLPSHCFEDFASDPMMSLANVLISINKLRHSAVHRLHTTAKGISEMIRSATRFAEALRDSACQQQLNELHHELKGKIRALELNKNFLETKLEHEMQEIARQRKELAEKEKQAIATTLREDKDYGSLIGILLSESVDHIFERSKNDELEPIEVERDLAFETTEEKNQEPAVNHEMTHQVKLNLPVKSNSSASHDLELEKCEPGLKSDCQSLPDAQQCAPPSPSTEIETWHETEATGWEIKDPASRNYSVPQEVHGTPTPINYRFFGFADEPKTF